MPRFAEIPTLLPLRERRRRTLLLAAMQRASGLEAERLEAALERATQESVAASDQDEVLPALVARMQAILRGAGLADSVPDVVLAWAFARSLVENALAEVRAEAQRAGHEESFLRLQPWLQAALPEADADRIATDTRQGTVGLQRAVERLRRRFRQRIESGLALWSAEGEQRQRLRRALHAAASMGVSA